jgi:hypothetical protein
MGQNIDLKQEFEDWMNDNRGFTLRSDRLSSDLSNIVHNPHMTSTRRMEIMTEWLRSAYLAGARTMAQDSLDTLRDYGTAVAGCPEPKRNPTECYDAAADNLMVYYTQILDRAEK